jgi:hypothetical protein
LKLSTGNTYTLGPNTSHTSWSYSSGSEHHFDGEHSGSDSDDSMGENQNVIPPWMSQGALNLPGPMHEFPKHPERLLPKFDPDKACSPEDHVKNLFLATRLLDVCYEDVVCRLFPYTFENKASTWYFNLPVGSITYWNDFEKSFIEKFGDEKTLQPYSRN